MKTDQQNLLEKQTYMTPQLTIYGSVTEITAQTIPTKQFGGSDGALWQQTSVSWAS